MLAINTNYENGFESLPSITRMALTVPPFEVGCGLKERNIMLLFFVHTSLNSQWVVIKKRGF